MLSILVLIACQSEPKQDPVLLEAAKVHEQAFVAHAEVEAKLLIMDQLVKQLEGMLADETADISDEKVASIKEELGNMDSLRNEITVWESSMVEVPGMPHNHKEGDDHHHHHNATDEKLKDLPSDQILEIQQELKAKIEAIKPEVDKQILRLRLLAGN